MLLTLSNAGKNPWLNAITEKKKSDGTDVLTKIRCVGICEECERSGDPDIMRACKHVPENYEDYRDEDNMEFMKLMYGKNTETFINQICGISVRSSGCCFKDNQLKPLKTNPRLKINKKAPIISLGIDPGKGGDYTGIVGVCPLPGDKHFLQVKKKLNTFIYNVELTVDWNTCIIFECICNVLCE
jgi:hypothetical protein